MTAQGTTEPKYLQSFHRLHLWQANGCRWHPLRAPSSAGQDRTPWTTQSSIWGAGGLLPHCMPPVPASCLPTAACRRLRPDFIEGLLQNPQNGEVKALSVSVP